jgi:AcrR family transcriptional regulator
MRIDLTTDKILAAALRTFGERGFVRTTMSEVAKVAGVSRPTVYARWKSKEEMYRAVNHGIFDRALQDVADAVARGGTLGAILGAVLDAYYGNLFDTVLGLEQWPELAEAQLAVASDIVADANARFRAELEGALRGARIADAAFTRGQLVDVMVLAPLAFKEAGTSAARYRSRLRVLARLVARACDEA